MEIVRGWRDLHGQFLHLHWLLINIKDKYLDYLTNAKKHVEKKIHIFIFHVDCFLFSFYLDNLFTKYGLLHSQHWFKIEIFS